MPCSRSMGTGSPRTLPSQHIEGWSLIDVLRSLRAVLDTGPLVNDVMRSAARDLASPLCLALQSHLVVGFAALHVWAEVPRVLRRRAESLNIPYESLEQTWWLSYVPHIRFVDCGELRSITASRELALRDPTDTDTLKLAGLHARCVILAEDGDIIASGLAYDNWRAFYEWATVTEDGRSNLRSVILGLSLTSRGTSAAVRGVKK